MNDDSDMGMVRSQGDDGTFNLAIGEPIFLQDEAWFARAIVPTDKVQYPEFGGEFSLCRELREVYGHDAHVVVTVGAKQGLSAAIWALQRDRLSSGYDSDIRVWHRRPYWPSYPHLVEHEGLRFETGAACPSPLEGDIVINTTPNNPDGDIDLSPCDIWDCAYASSLYGWTGPGPQARVRVYSAAKMLGLSGLRVGWVVTEESHLAHDIATYVERFTSGVCVSAQEQVALALRHLSIFHDRGLTTARDTLVGNGQAFTDILSRYCSEVDGVPATASGMFAWFRVLPELRQGAFDKALAVARVRVIAGASCGAVEDGWYRMSMGNRSLYTAEALKGIHAALQQ